MAVTGTPSAGNDTLTSDGDDDTIIGIQGNDTIFGGGGNDVILGDIQFGINGQLDSNQADNGFSFGSVAGWSNSTTSGLIERWGDGFLGLNTADGSSFIELDSFGGGGVDFLHTDIDLDTGVEYVFSIDHAARAGAGVNDDFEVVVNGTVIATVSPSTSSSFSTSTFTITGADGVDEIGFREIASQSNGLGPLLDNFTLNISEPAAIASGDTFDDSIFPELNHTSNQNYGPLALPEATGKFFACG